MKVVNRGSLRCGVTKKLGFAELNNKIWTGFDVEFCRALSAALFSRNSSSALEFVDIANVSERFAHLARADVDVLAGEPVNLINGWREPTTRMAYSYSPPYFYSNAKDEAFALAVRQDDNDSQFADFVYWVVMSIFYADEEGYNQTTSVSMPVVDLFGEDLKQMLRDCIYEVGSYGEIYNRTLQALIPRTGRNNLNSGGGPQLFGFPFT